MNWELVKRKFTMGLGVNTLKELKSDGY